MGLCELGRHSHIYTGKILLCEKSTNNRAKWCQ